MIEYALPSICNLRAENKTTPFRHGWGQTDGQRADQRKEEVTRPAWNYRRDRSSKSSESHSQTSRRDIDDIRGLLETFADNPYSVLLDNDYMDEWSDFNHFI